MTLSIFLKIMALAILELVLDQNFYYMGVKLTSASFASALVNIVPAVTILMAIVLRIEKMNIRRRHGQAKIVGAFVTVVGALLLMLYKGPVIEFVWSKGRRHHSTAVAQGSSNWLKGTFMLLGSCFCWSSFYILQGVVCSGITFYVRGKVMKERGPVFVTAFNPLCMIITAVLGSIILAEDVTLGSVIRAAIIVTGLYSLLWGKSKDHLNQHSKSSENEGAFELPMAMTDAGKSGYINQPIVVVDTPTSPNPKS